MTATRASGILLHPTALPGPYGIGDLGDSACRFIDFLAASGQSVWQVLPLGPTGYGNSPYSAFSAFAGNPLLISPDRLLAAGDIVAAELPPHPHPCGKADYALALAGKGRMLRHAARRFFAQGGAERLQAFDSFCTRHRAWLDDYALFRALRATHGHRAWTAWPAPLRDRDPAALTAAAAPLSEAIQAERYTQFVFYQQWQELQAYARQRGIRLFGDIPIFVADDSADVWAQRHLFQLDPEGRPLRVAGVPPDYFSATGQRWGNPLYDWDRLAADGFAWWIDRLRHNLLLYDLVRIDHFRGFEACWAIPASEPTAINGRWEAVPGEAFFRTATEALGPLPVVAEDLGIITPAVEALRDRFGFPGMKILQFAFGGDPRNPYLPHNHTPNSVVYTGTHDNATTAGWWRNAGEAERCGLARYLGRTPELPVQELLRLALGSVARLSILPLQDVLTLGDEARFNTPGAPHGNWEWRLDSPAPLDEATRALAELTAIYGRHPNK